MLNLRIDSEPAADVDPRKSISGTIVEVLFLLLLPPVVFFSLHISSINQAGTLDPYFYTGYIHNIQDLIDRYGFAYYSVRFGLILPARAISLVFGFDRGYFIFRYLLVLTGGIPFYLVAKRMLGRPSAMVFYAALLVTPFFTRSLLWDHPDAAAVPYLCGGIGLFMLETRHSRLRDAAVGMLFGLAIHSNFFCVSICGLFLAVFAMVTLIFRRPLMPLMFRFAWVGLGFALSTGIGVVYYHRLGRIWNIFFPSFQVVSWLTQGGMKDWRIPGFAWVATSYHVLLLPFVTVFAALVFRLRAARFEWVVAAVYCGAITLYFYIYQFAFQGDILQLAYYFAYSLPAILFLFPMLFSQLWGDFRDRYRTWFAICLGIAFLVPWIVRVYAWDWTQMVTFHRLAWLAGITAATLSISLFVRPSGRLKLGFVSVATWLFGALFAGTFTTMPYSGMFRPVANATEANVYHVAEQLIAVVPKFREHPGEICFWYSNRKGNLLNSVQSTFLWGFSRCSSPISKSPGLPVIGDAELKRFRTPAVRYVELMSENEKDLDQGLRALSQAEIRYVQQDSRTLSYGDYRVYLTRVQLLH